MRPKSYGLDPPDGVEVAGGEAGVCVPGVVAGGVAGGTAGGVAGGVAEPGAACGAVLLPAGGPGRVGCTEIDPSRPEDASFVVPAGALVVGCAEVVAGVA